MVKYSKKNNAGLKCFTVPTGKVVCAKKSKFKPYNINKDKRLTTKAKKKMMATRIQQRVRKQKELKDKPKKTKAGSKIVKKLKSNLKVKEAKKVLKKKKINKEIKYGGRKTLLNAFVKKNKKVLKGIKIVSTPNNPYKNRYDYFYGNINSSSRRRDRITLKEMKNIIKNKDIYIKRGKKDKELLREREAILEKYKPALLDKPSKIKKGNMEGMMSSMMRDKSKDAMADATNQYEVYKVLMRTGGRTAFTNAEAKAKGYTINEKKPLTNKSNWLRRLTPAEFEAKIIKEVGKNRLKKFNI